MTCDKNDHRCTNQQSLCNIWYIYVVYYKGYLCKFYYFLVKWSIMPHVLSCLQHNDLYYFILKTHTIL